MRAAASAIAVALITSSLVMGAAPATAADRREPSAVTSERAVAARSALTRAQSALAGRGGDATLALRDLHRLRDALSPSERATADRLSARPSKSRRISGGNVMVHYSPTDMLLSSFTAKDVLNNALLVSRTYSNAGYRQPKPDGGKGGSSQIDIYVDQLDIGLYGYCTIDDDTKQPAPDRYDVPAYCVVDADYFGFPEHTPLQNLQVTLAHEYFHAVQFAYDYLEDGWWMEATAAWAEDEVFDGVDDNVQYLADSPITDTVRSMDLFGGVYHYGVWIFFRYLTETFPKAKGGLPLVILDFWKAADSSKGAKKDKYSTQAIDSVLGHGRYMKLPFDKAFSFFADATRRARTVFDEGRANSYPERQLAGSAALAKGASKTFATKLDHLASATYRFTPQRGKHDLVLKISGPAKVAGTRAVVTVWKAGGRVKQKFVSISRRGKGSMKVGFKAGRVTAVEVTLVNASIRYRGCFPPQAQESAYACSGTPRDEGRTFSVRGRVV